MWGSYFIFISYERSGILSNQDFKYAQQNLELQSGKELTVSVERKKLNP